MTHREKLHKDLDELIDLMAVRFGEPIPTSPKDPELWDYMYDELDVLEQEVTPITQFHHDLAGAIYETIMDHL